MLDSQLKKQAQLREVVLSIIVILAIFYAIYVNLYTPKRKANDFLAFQVTELNEKKAGIEKLNAALQKKYDQQKIELKKQARLAATQDPKMLMLKDYKDPIFKDISEFLNAVTQPSFRSTVRIANLRYDLPKVKRGYKETAFYLNVNGRFSKIIEFITKLEGVPALVTLDKINLQVSKTDTNQVTLDLNGTFYQLEN